MNLIIRRATLSDIPQMVDVDRQAWWDEVAFTADQFESQIDTYPHGVFVAERVAEDGVRKIVGTICGFRISLAAAEAIRSWSQTTGDGYFTTHEPDGEAAFGANLSVLPEVQRSGVGDKLFGHVAAVIVRDNMRFIVLGGRLPGLAQWNNKRSEEGLAPTSGEEYATLKDERGRIVDGELRFYAGQPFMEVGAVLPNYFPDPESENYGVLLRWWNPIYRFHLGWLYRIPVLGKIASAMVAGLVRRAV